MINGNLKTVVTSGEAGRKLKGRALAETEAISFNHC